MSAVDWGHVDDRGHCVHCGDQSHCQLQQHRTQDALVGWLAACCPYNAEAKRIAALIEAERKQRAGLAEASVPPVTREYHRGVDHGLVLGLRAVQT